MAKNKYISDSGVIDKSNLIDKLVTAACIIVSKGLINLGFMAYWVG